MEFGNEASVLSSDLRTQYEELIALLEDKELKQKRELLRKQKEIETLKM